MYEWNVVTVERFNFTR